MGVLSLKNVLFLLTILFYEMLVSNKNVDRSLQRRVCRVRIDKDRLFPAVSYMLKVNNRNTRAKCEKCSKLTIKVPVLVSLLLTLNIFHTLF